jgi:hypoxia up-regulated 1
MNDFVEDERGMVAYQMFTLDKKKIKEGQETEIHYTEEIIGHILKYGRNLAEKQAGGNVFDAVITIPSYFEREQKLLLLQAAEFAGLNVAQLVHENVAAATYFGLERMDETPYNVMFYNMGGQDTEVTIAKYEVIVNKQEKEVEQITILGEGWDSSLGGAAFDDVLVEILAERFNDLKDRQGKEDVRKNTRAIKRLYKESTKVKEVLSANKVMQVKIPELLDYVTLDTMLYRTDFEERCEHLISRVANPVQQALDKAGLTKEDIDDIEILGGGVRVPRVAEVLKETTGKEILNVHLNGDEAMSFGATFLASNSSSLYRMRKVYLTQSPTHDYKISISPLGGDDQAVIEEPETADIPEGE